MKVFLHGADNIGWSLDSDRDMIRSTLDRMQLCETTSAINADIVHNLCWQEYFSGRSRLLLLKRGLAATCSSFTDPDEMETREAKQFIIARSRVKAWISPSIRQHEKLIKHGMRSYLIPFTINLGLFSPEVRNRKNQNKMLAEWDIDASFASGRFIIGSFQRDSLGSDLKRAKWQKGADLLIEILSVLPRSKYFLLLAGPRRHFIIRECKKKGIPYWYIGNETEKDDICENSLTIEKMPSLYALCDCYIISSRSEGGPKAALEAVATNTPVISSDVGLAPDFIDGKYIYKSVYEAQRMLLKMIDEHKSHTDSSVIAQRMRLINILAAENIDTRIIELYNAILRRKI
jgi:glycosyltransferase involved in cell wall biosynthesis